MIESQDSTRTTDFSTFSRYTPQEHFPNFFSASADFSFKTFYLTLREAFHVSGVQVGISKRFVFTTDFQYIEWSFPLLSSPPRDIVLLFSYR
jgi:hypothetical protein